MEWHSDDEGEPMLSSLQKGVVSELSYSSSEEENGSHLPPWCKPLANPSQKSPKNRNYNNQFVLDPPPTKLEKNLVNQNYLINCSLDVANSNDDHTLSTNSSLNDGLAALDSLYSELDLVCSLTRKNNVRSRRDYARLDAGSMGVDLTAGPLTVLDQSDQLDNSFTSNNSLSDDRRVMGRKNGSSGVHSSSSLIEDSSFVNTQHLKSQLRDIEKTSNDLNKRTTDEELKSESFLCESQEKEKSVFDSSHIPHITPLNSQDLYAVPVKNFSPKGGQDLTEERGAEEEGEKTDPPSEVELPFGWEKHEDDDGPYYWHIKSGTITRSHPDASTRVSPHPPVSIGGRRINNHEQMIRSATSSALCDLSEVRFRSHGTSRNVDNSYKRRSFPARSDLTDPSAGSTGRPIRFAVRSLGWVEIAEEDLTPERSSKAVNRCIVDLSSVGAKKDLLDMVGRWGDGKDLFMDLDEGALKLVDPENLTLLNSQPIHSIRVWGVGRDTGRERDFAYVARDKVTRRHMCHVFRCDSPARTIANTLRDICKKIMIERSLQPSRGNTTASADQVPTGSNSVLNRISRPNNFASDPTRRFQKHSQLMTQPPLFPTPMEEPKKLLKAEYVGSEGVSRPSGMEVINAAIESIVENNPAPWKPVTVAVAPSTVTITDAEDGHLLAECRVRFLSFLGIGQDVKHCAFIMHTAQDQFVAHVFRCEPSSGALCKTIEAACKLRYQKCLDAHPGGSDGLRMGEGGQRSFSSALKSVFASLAVTKKSRSTES